MKAEEEAQQQEATNNMSQMSHEAGGVATANVKAHAVIVCHRGECRPQEFHVEVVEEETDLPQRSVSGIGYEAYGADANIEYFSTTNRKWRLGRKSVNMYQICCT